MTTTPKDPIAVIEQLVTALEKLLGPENYESEDLVNAWTALTAGHEALEQRKVEAVSYRLLQSGIDRIEPTDEFLSDDTSQWAVAPNAIFAGMLYGGEALRPARRATHPQASEPAPSVPVAAFDRQFAAAEAMAARIMELEDKIESLTQPAPSTAGEREDGESEIIDRVRAHLVVMEPPTRDTKTIVQQSAELAYDKVEQQIVARYRVESTNGGFWPCCIKAGDGTGDIFVGSKKQAEHVRQALQTACLDGAFMASQAKAIDATQPAKVDREQKIIVMPVSASAGDLKVDISELIQSHKYKGLRSVEVLGVFQFLGAEIISGSTS